MAKKKHAAKKKKQVIAKEKYDHVLKPEVLKRINAQLGNDDPDEESEYPLDATHPEVLYRVDAEYYGIGKEDDPSEIFAENIDGLPLTRGRDGETFEVGVYRLVEVKHIRIRVEEVKGGK